ncbi:glycerophosphodiester phosphodiesterase [Paenibacillus sp. CN-4]|uniref:glycerophosphodiester phosphodiesterase n=1 Tax=Paenibacillus nanchangensis TaxID=3348343 RepID=UPI00397BDAFF
MAKKEVSALYFYTLHALIGGLILALSLQIAGGGLSLAGLFNSGPEIAAVGHRGASAYAPENTLASFRLAQRMGANYLEMDLQLTRDGEIVLMHDETVNRTTNGRGRVNRMTLEQLKKLDAGAWFNKKHPMYAREEYAGEKVPTLREVFEEFGDEVHYMLETKEPAASPGLEARLVELAKEYRLEDRVAVQSFSKDSLRTIHTLSDKIPLFLLIWHNNQANISDRELAEFARYGTGIASNFQRLNREYVEKVKSAGLLVYAYTVNYQVNMAKAVGWGVDGVHTDYPDRLTEVIEAANE